MLGRLLHWQLFFRVQCRVGPTGSQFLTGRVPQRDGILCLACSNTHLRCSSSTASSPLWRCSGVTKRSLLCRCSVLYQRTNRSTHIRTSNAKACHQGELCVDATCATLK